MAPSLEKRQYACVDGRGNIVDCNSSWYDWGRWVTLVIVLVGIVLLFFLCSCFSARRRRRQGLRPRYGTGWAGQAPFGHGPAQYNPNYPQQQPYYPQPQGGPPNQYGGYYGGPPSYYQSSQPTGDSNRGYFGNQNQQEFEMQPPQRVYGNDLGTTPAPEVSGAKK